MRFQTIISLGTTALLSLALAACGSGSGTTTTASAPPVAKVSFEPGTTMDRLNKAQKISIGTKYDQPLFGLQGLAGKPEGFDVEIAKIIAAELGIPETGITWVETPSKVREEALEQKRADVIVATYTINDLRKQRVTFAGPYYVAGQDLMIKSDNTKITGPESLKAAGAKVCSGTGTAPAEKILKYIDPSQLVLFDVYSKCADALRTGQADAVTTDNAILFGLAGDSRGAFKVLDKPFTQEPWGIGVPKGDVKFCTFINEVLTKISSDGRYADAWARTAGAASGTTAKLPELAPCV
jgi:glutamate transport system substrate-binding protein